MQDSLIQLFPLERREFWSYICKQEAWLQEIRIRVDKPILVFCGGREWFVDSAGRLTEELEQAYCANGEELKALLSHICHYSLYAYEDEMRQGFITVAGGHRVGIAGQVVVEGMSGVRTMKHISYMNIRVAHQIIGVADKVLPFLYHNGKLQNTLIISPPGCGKTTLLRDIIRQVSNGSVCGRGMSVGVVDERSEIAGSYHGQAQNDVGMRTDVLDACPKVMGMMMLLRSMAPGAIAVDELGSEMDMQALHTVSACGSRILATVHGDDIEDYIQKYGAWDNRVKPLFDIYFVLGKKDGIPALKKVCRREDVYAAYSGGRYDGRRQSGTGIVV